MVVVTNDMADFFEHQPGKIYIYGCGQYGYWVSEFMNRSNIAFDGFLDGKIAQNEKELYYYGKKLYSPKKELGNSEEQIRIIIATIYYSEVLKDLLFWFGDESRRVLCLVSEWKYFGAREFQINKLLGYFRNKLLCVKDISIIANNCIGGLLYEYMGFSNMPTPTINTYINACDYQKLLERPHYYLSMPMKDFYRTKIQWNGGGEVTFAARLDDVEVVFTHIGNQSGERLIERWNYLCDQIKWDNILFVYGENYRFYDRLSSEEKEKIGGGKYKYPVLYIPANDEDESHQRSITNKIVNDHNTVIEMYYDLLGNINNALKKCRR